MTSHTSLAHDADIHSVYLKQTHMADQVKLRGSSYCLCGLLCLGPSEFFECAQKVIQFPYLTVFVSVKIKTRC